AHAVGAGSEYPDLADAVDPGQGVLHVDDRVVGEEGLVVAIVLGIEARHQQDVGGDLEDRSALRSDASRQLREGGVDAVLDQGQRGVEVRSHFEGDGEGIRAVAGARRGHVNGVLDAVDRLLHRHPGRPGAAFSTPLTTTHSLPVRPVAMTRWLSTAAPVVTGRRSTTFLSFTTSRYAPCWSCPTATSGTNSAVRCSSGTRTRV